MFNQKNILIINEGKGSTPPLFVRAVQKLALFFTFSKARAFFKKLGLFFTFSKARGFFKKLGLFFTFSKARVFFKKLGLFFTFSKARAFENMFKIVFFKFVLHMLEMAELTLWQDVALKVKDLQVRFDAFETDNRMSDYFMTELDEELEEGRVGLEKLEKRVRELETDLPELIAERVATLKTENAELRHRLNLVVDAVNNITRIWNEQVHEGEPEAVGDQSMQDNEVLTLPQDEQPAEDPPQLTLQQVYNMYQSQPRDEEGWEEMTNAIEAAEKYEASLPIRTNGLRKNGTIY